MRRDHDTVAVVECDEAAVKAQRGETRCGNAMVSCVRSMGLRNNGRTLNLMAAPTHSVCVGQNNEMPGILIYDID